MTNSPDFSRDYLRREAKESQRLHEEIMPGYRNALTRLFGDSSSNPTAKSMATLNGLDRRGFLRLGGTTVLGAAVLAACSSTKVAATTTTTGAATTTTVPLTTTTGAVTTTGPVMAEMTMDVLVLRTAQSIEELAVVAYQTAIDSGLVKTGAIGDAAKLFQAQHKEHAALFASLTKKAGGDPFTKPNPAILDAITPAIKALKDETGIVRLALDLETAAAETYQSNVGMFMDLTLNQAIMTVGGVEARHVAALSSVLQLAPVPKAFQITDKAVAYGTGVK